MLLPWFATQLVLAVLSALVAGPGRLRVTATVLLLAAASAVPWIAPPVPIPRVFLSLIAAIILIKDVQIATTKEPWPVWRRIWHMLEPFDSREARFVRPAVDFRILANVLVQALIAGTMVLALMRLGALPPVLRPPLRYVCWALFVCAWMDVAMEPLRFLHRLVGISFPAVQVAPLLSRSVGEFWGRRWNRPISGWLNRYVFLPLARRRLPALGILLAFAVSGFFHAWMVSASMPFSKVALIWTFFMAQCVALLLERRWSIRQWPIAPARAWTLLFLLTTSPLFFDPFLSLIGL